MIEKLTHKHHKGIITLLIFIVFVLGLAYGIKTYEVEYKEHTVEIVSIGLMFVNTLILIIIASILVKLEEDFFYHHALLKKKGKK